MDMEKDLYRILFESSVDAILLVEGDRFVECNGRALAVFGCARDDLIGQSSAKFSPPTQPDGRNSTQLVMDKIAAALAGEPQRFEWLYQRLDGSNFYAQVTLHRVDLDGRALLQVCLRDVSEHKRVVPGLRDSDLRQSERRLNAQHAATRVLAESATLVEATPKVLQAICEGLDWEWGEFWTLNQQKDGLVCLETWHSPSAQMAEFEAITRQTVFAHGIGLPGRVWASGQPAWIIDVTRDPNFPRAPVATRVGLHSAFAVPVVLENQFLGAIGFLTRRLEEPDSDLLNMFAAIGSQMGQFIERRRIQESLRDSEARQRQIMDTMPLGIVVSRQSDGLVIDANEQFPIMFGLSASEVIGRSTPNFYYDPSERAVMLAELRRRGSLRDYELRVQRQDDGQMFWASLSILPMTLGGEPVLLSTLADISERKRVEAQVERNLRETQVRYDIGQALAVAQTEGDVLDVLVQRAGLYPQARVMFYTFDRQGEDVAIILRRDNVFESGLAAATPVGTRFLASRYPLINLLSQDRPFISNDFLVDERVDPASRQLAQQIGANSMAAFPLTVGGEWMGFTIAFAKSAGYFDETRQHLYQTLAELGAAALQTARLRDQIRESLARRGAQVQTSTEVAQEIAAVQNLDELYRRVVTLVKERFGYYHAQIFRYDAAQDAVALVTGYGEAGEKMLAAGHRLAAGRGVVGTAADTGQPVLATDVAQDKDWRPNPNLPETKGELAVPIKLRDEVLGILDVQSDRVGALTADDQLLLEGLCGQIAVAMESTRLLEQADIFRRFAEASGQGLGMADLEGNIVYINPALLRILGLGSAKEALGSPLLPYDSSEAQQQLQSEVLPTVMREGQWTGELALRSVTGNLTPTVQTLFLIRDRDGSPAYLASVITDITERKRTEAETAERLRELDALYRTISREGWQAFRESAALPGGYLFDPALFTMTETDVPDPVSALKSSSARTSEENVLAVPLELRGERIGAVGIDVDPQSPLSPEDQALVQSVLEQAVQALESARLSETTQAALTETRTLYNLAQVTSGETNLQAVYDAVARSLVEELGYVSSWIAAFDQDAGVLRGVAGAGVETGALQRIIPLSQATGTSAQDPAVVAFQEHRSLAINDPSDNPLLATMPAEMVHELGKIALVPLVVGEEALGVMSVSRSLAGSDISEPDLRLLGAVASQVAVAIQRGRLLAQTRAALADAEAAHRRYLRETWESFLAGRGAQVGGYLARQDAVSPAADFWTPEMEQATLRGEAVQLTRGQDAGRPPVKAVALPIQHRGQTIGVLDIGREGAERDWTEDELNLLQSLTQEVGDIIESERLFEESEVTRAQTERLYQASRLISAADSPEDVYPVILDVVKSTAADRAAILVFDSPVQGSVSGQQAKAVHLTVAAFWDRENAPAPAPLGTSRPAEQDPFLSAMTPGEVLTISDVEAVNFIAADDRLQGIFREASRAMGVRAMTLTPLAVGDEWLGYISVTFVGPHAFAPDELQIYRSIADQAAIVLRSLRLYREAESRARREQLIREITSRMRVHADVDSILSTAVRELGQALGVSRAFIRLTSEGRPSDTPESGS